MRADQIGAGIACLPNRDLPSVLAWLAENRFAAVEILAYEGARHSMGALPGLWFDDASADDLERLRRALAPFSGVSVHAPFVDAPLFTYNRRIAQEVLRQVKVSLEGCGRIGGRAVAVHANRRAMLDAEDFWDDLVGVFRDLGDTAREHGVVVGLETGYPAKVEQFIRLIRDIDHPAVGATVDIGHVAFYDQSEPRCTPEGVANYNRALEYVLRELGERVVHAHVHDVRLSDWRDHRTLGTGVIDVPAVVSAFDAIGYAGLLQFELEEPEPEAALLESRRHLEAMLST